MRKLKIKRALSVDDLLLVDGLSKRDSVLTPLGEVKKDIPLRLRLHLDNVMKVKPQGSMGGYRSKQLEPDRVKSVYEDIPALSSSVVEYEKKHGQVAHTNKPKWVSNASYGDDLNFIKGYVKHSENRDLSGLLSLTPAASAVDSFNAAKEFIANPSFESAAMVAVAAIPGRVADKFSVGAYDKIKGTVPNMDAHHVGQKALMNKFIPDYDLNKAPAILVPKVGHTLKGPNGIVSRKTTGIDTARGLIARDIKELRRVYPDIPNSQLKKLIDMNKELYPDAFLKRK
ncbi:hypothetical protein ACTFQ5_20960 [Aliivibrio fischeri]|uniref:hypothetical protein n=1 Tax=Aliivibrio fischeri TaxID=668 RepID=UPI00191273AE|nr:hypothetical protein [Aliivibrio fischeri]